jgi:hypothetical protein
MFPTSGTVRRRYTVCARVCSAAVTRCHARAQRRASSEPTGRGRLRGSAAPRARGSAQRRRLDGPCTRSVSRAQIGDPDGWCAARGAAARPMSACETSGAGAGPGGAHLGRIDRGLRQQPAMQEDSDLVGIDCLVFRLATVDGSHRQGMAEDQRDGFPGPEVGKPGPK